MHPFLARSALATAAAMLALASLATALLARSNELYSFEAVVASEDDILWGPAFSQMDFAYKRERARWVRPEVLVLGSSRANQFRAAMMPGARFYSAAGAAHSFEEAEQFLAALYETHRPGLVILVIDPWWFKAAENETAPVGVPREFGYRAAKMGTGYRPDGSVQYGGFLLGTDPYYDLDRYGFRNGFTYYGRAIREETGRFGYAGPLSARALVALDRVLSLNRKWDVDTILLLPPLAHALYRAVVETPSQRDYFDRFEAALAARADAAGVELFVLHDLAVLGIEDAHTIDGVHGDELAYLALTDRMAEDGATLARHIDRAALAVLLARMRDPANRIGPHRIAR